MQETYRAHLWLQTVLTGDTAFMAIVTGGVYADVAPAGTSAPYAVHTVQAATDVLGSAATRVMTSHVAQVVIYGPSTSYATLATAADRMDTLLGLARNGSTSDSTILACYREQEIDLSELVSASNGASVVWKRVGGLYRLLITP